MAGSIQGAEANRSLPGLDTRSASHARADRAKWGSALLVSVVLHAAVLTLWPGFRVQAGSENPEAAVHADLVPLTLVRLVEAPAPEPALATARLVATVVSEPTAPRITHSPAGLDLTPETGRAWTPPVIGPVAAPATGSEDEGDYIPAMALSILQRWRPRIPVHGVEIVARIFTTSDGHASGPVELVPPTPSRQLNQDIVDRVRQLRYRPASRGGLPVPEWADITFIFCHGKITATSPATPSGRADPCSQPSVGGEGVDG